MHPTLLTHRYEHSDTPAHQLYDVTIEPVTVNGARLYVGVRTV